MSTNIQEQIIKVQAELDRLKALAEAEPPVGTVIRFRSNYTSLSFTSGSSRTVTIEYVALRRPRGWAIVDVRGLKGWADIKKRATGNGGDIEVLTHMNFL